jgi:hypothetical protein
MRWLLLGLLAILALLLPPPGSADVLPGDRADSPARLRLRAGARLVGHVRDLTGSPGNYVMGDIDFAWSFVPASLAGALGPVPISLEFDLGTYAPQVVTRTLNVVPPIHLPLIAREQVR